MSVEKLITENLDIWTSAIKTRSASGRGSSNKLELFGIKKLRELILELAVRGKLVPQDPNDEPADKMLERISAEKEQLVKDGKIKRQKPLPSISEAKVPFKLPHGWSLARMPEVIKQDKYAIKRGPFGSALKKAYFVSEGFKVYEQQHAINDDFYRGEYYVNEEKFEELKAFEVVPGDLIISCSGTVGKVAEAPLDMERGIINQALLKVSLNEEILVNDYFKILFPTYFMKTETLSDLQGTAQKNMVSVDTLKSEPFPLPPLEEQKHIVAKVDVLMDLCDQLESQTETSIEAHQSLVKTLLETLTNAKDADELNESWQRISEHFDVLFTTEDSIDQLKQTILQLAVMGKLVKQEPNDEPASKLLDRIAAEKDQLVKDRKIKKQKPLPPVSDEEKPFELPQWWSWSTINQLAKQVTDGVHHTPQYIESGVPFISVKDIDGKTIKFSDCKYISKEQHEEINRRCNPEFGDMLICRIGTLGRPTIVDTNEPFSIFVSVGLIKYFQDYLCPEFFHIALSSPLLTYQYDQIKAGGSHTNKLNLGDIPKLKIPVAPISEQKRIVSKVDELMALCDTLKARLNDAQTTQLQLTDAIVEQAS